jgi:hypothetical protein
VIACCSLAACAGEEWQPDPPVTILAGPPAACPIACRYIDQLAVVASTAGGSRTPSASQVAREWAAEHGANYMAIDEFSVSSDLEPTITIRARLFACAPP